GQGITILNAEGSGDHQRMTSGVIKDYAPDATLLESVISGRTSGDKVIETTVTINGERLDFEEAIDKYNIQVVTRSYSGATSKARLNYFKDIQKRKGVIFVNSAGNDGTANGVWSKNDTAITVSACQIKEGNKLTISYYGSKGEVDFTCFMARGTGTSAASPALASMLILLLQRYGDFNQVESVEILKSISMKLPNIEEYKQGWGLPILPLTDKLEILERLRGKNMTKFKDVEDTRWSKKAIDFCVEKGLLVGFEDGTFRPDEPVTREQIAVILQRILNL
ncbi:MAG: S8 family serine peptidase, partial [Clostridiales bacterium]|nr:S8 family serine peptidase [Clostridiales bacterium]